METYNNDYSKDEDEMLWELHEIRHELIKEFEKKTIEEINHQALKKFDLWQKKLKNKN